MRSISCIFCFSGMLIFFIIFGSSEDGLDSMRSVFLIDLEFYSEEYFFSRSWYGILRDEIDFVFEDYEIILLDLIIRVRVFSVVDDEVEEFFGMDLDYVEVNFEWGFIYEYRFDY